MSETRVNGEIKNSLQGGANKKNPDPITSVIDGTEDSLKSVLSPRDIDNSLYYSQNNSCYTYRFPISDFTNNGLVDKFRELKFLEEGEGIDFLAKVIDTIPEYGNAFRVMVNANNNEKRGKNPQVPRQQVQEAMKVLSRVTIDSKYFTEVRKQEREKFYASLKK